MWQLPSTLVALSLFGLPLEPAGASPSWVLAPASEAVVARCLDVGRPLAGGQHIAAAIEADKVHVRLAAKTESGFHVLLVHPSTVPSKTTSHAGVAIVSRGSAGPQESRWTRAVIARLEACTKTIPWTRLEPPAPTPAPATPPQRGAGIEGLHGSLDRAHNRISVDKPKEARAILRTLPEELTAEAAVEVALAWRLAGEPSVAARVLDRLGTLRPPLDTFAAVVRAETHDVDVALERLTASNACAYAHVAELQAQLGAHPRAIATAKRVRELAPACVRAWELEVSERALHGDAEVALRVGDDAVRVHPQDAGLLSAVASARLQSGQVDAAIALLERVARRSPRPSGILRVLLGAMVRSPDRRGRSRSRLEARLESGEADDIDRFLLGVVRHYENEFASSNALLEPLEALLRDEDRLQIYRAMNDFNLGDRQAAMDRLESAEKRNDPDPDIYYCLAELLRDTDRPRALESLKRYAASSHNDPMSNPAKEERIGRLVRGLEACIRDGRGTCDGEWEHPRNRYAGEEDSQKRRAWIFGGAAALAVVAIGLRRRRRAAER